MPELLKEQWNASYTRGDNLALYPKEEVVKFLNRHVRKRTGPDTFRDVLRPRAGEQNLRGLDFGCGVGRQTVLLEEFGITAWGVDISDASLRVAQQLCDQHGYHKLKGRLLQLDGPTLPFEDGFFDLAIAACVLDSMTFELAQRAVRELDRVTARLLYVDLISGDNDCFHPEYDGEEIVTHDLERGTVQSYFNWSKVRELFEPTRFHIRTGRLITEQSVTDRYRYGRYYVVLEK